MNLATVWQRVWADLRLFAIAAWVLTFSLASLALYLFPGAPAAPPSFQLPAAPVVNGVPGRAPDTDADALRDPKAPAAG